MQRTLRWTLLLSAIVLACGCDSKPRLWGELDGHPLEVDGVQYIVKWSTVINRQEQIALSFVTCHRVNVSVLYPAWERTGDTFIGTVRPTIGKDISTKSETLYFACDQHTVFEKTYQELGIDASRLNTENDDEVLAYLQPILEKLIREHVPPQDSETEEQEE